MNLLKNLCSTALLAVVFSSDALGEYSKLSLEDKPVAYWRFTERNATNIVNTGILGNSIAGIPVYKLAFGAGPQPIEFPDFESDNSAASFNGKSSFIRVKTAADNPLAFKLGDTISIEAWVNASQFESGQDIYIIGKGRTRNAGFADNNQNWGLRLRGVKGEARLSFLFRDERNLPNDQNCWHRWVSNKGFAPGSGWHRVAISYTFGKGDSLRGWVDDKEIPGRWDYGGKTDLGPVVDADEVWIGSSQGGAASSTFRGYIDEIAIYRGALSSERLAQRYIHKALPVASVIADEIPKFLDAPADSVRVQILESGSKSDDAEAIASVGADSGDTAEPAPMAVASWKNLPAMVVDEFSQSAMGFAALPTKYSNKGIKLDRPAPFLVRAASKIKLPPGEYQVLVRARNAARLTIDGRAIADTPLTNNKHADAEDVPDQAAKSIPGIRTLPPGHVDKLATFKSDGLPHIFVFDVFVGGKKLRPEVGEACVAVAGTNGQFILLAPKAQVALIDEAWAPYAAAQSFQMAERDVAQRRIVAREEDNYWVKRHAQAREMVSKKASLTVPPAAKGHTGNNEIDNFINQKLAASNAVPTKLLDDDAFLRRVTLDTLGLIPTPDQIGAFHADKSAEHRAKAIDRLLANPSWADHWVGYWQDVLAENPGMLKPTLNNTGPFRGFIYDSFRDNKPMDRFLTELVQMEGSLYSGGPAGFSMASENDVPMAAKAHIVSKAFLGMELGCARCHDAPYHPFKQEQLFSLAAMLKRAPEKVPTSSSIPPNSNIQIGRVVKVTLAPGSVVKPAWPFSDVLNHGELSETVRHKGDTREELAALITDPANDRFPRVIVNRVWKQYLGWGLVEPVDDWAADAKVSHPELLDWLAREFVTSGYDLKHVARLILNSQAYQRTAQSSSMQVPALATRLFEGPARRRLTAEQLVDSLFAACGKSFESEELNQDVDGRRPVQDFNNLGIPKRAWEFCSLANERDRPALALPRAQAIVDTLMMFGWRESRPNPLTVRDDSPNVLQPANLANSTLAGRVVRLSDDSVFTQLALENRSLPELINATFLRILSRPPSEEELKMFSGYLEPHFADRRLAVKAAQKASGPKQAVSWSNHLNAEATKIKLDLQREARVGDPASAALRADWRERMEDMVWALVNSPEFIFVP